MTMQQKQSLPSVEMLTKVLEQLAELLRHSGSIEHGVIAGEFDRLGELVGALALTTDDYCFAVNGIKGARAYRSADDRGAARYQLRMIGKKLAR